MLQPYNHCETRHETAIHILLPCRNEYTHIHFFSSKSGRQGLKVLVSHRTCSRAAHAEHISPLSLSTLAGPLCLIKAYRGRLIQVRMMAKLVYEETLIRYCIELSVCLRSCSLLLHKPSSHHLFWRLLACLVRHRSRVWR